MIIRPGLPEFCTAYQVLKKTGVCPIEHCGGRLWAESHVYPPVVEIKCHNGHSWEASRKEIKDVKFFLCAMQEGIQKATSADNRGSVLSEVRRQRTTQEAPRRRPSQSRRPVVQFVHTGRRSGGAGEGTGNPTPDRCNEDTNLPGQLDKE